VILYSDINGTHVCGGTADIQRLQGVDTRLRNIVATDESGQIIGVQGGELSLQKSTQLIKSMREGKLLMKAQPVRKTFITSKPAVKTEMLHKSFSSGLYHLHREMDKIRRMQNA
jgi:hypothetical protein